MEKLLLAVFEMDTDRIRIGRPRTRILDCWWFSFIPQKVKKCLQITKALRRWCYQCCRLSIYLSLGLHKVRPSYRRSLQLSKEAIQHFKTWTLTNCFYFCGSFFPSLIRIRIHWPDWIRIRNPAFLTLGSGSGWDKILGWTSQMIFPRAYKQCVGSKILSSLMRIRIRDLFDPRSGMEIFGFGIRYKHLGPATLGVKLATNNITSFPTLN